MTGLADNKSKVSQMTVFVPDRVENQSAEGAEGLGIKRTSD